MGDTRTIGLAALGVYALLLATGGVMGYLKANSRPSLVAGLASAAATLGAILLALLASTTAGFALGLVVAAALIAVFFDRWRKTGKFMPGGMLCVVSAAVAALLAVLMAVPG